MVYIRKTAVFGGISLALRGSAAFGGGKMKYTKFGAPRVRHWGRRRKNKSFLKKKLPQGHADSEYVLSFEIGQQESGLYSGRTDRQTNPPSTVLVYRWYIYFHNINALIALKYHVGWLKHKVDMAEWIERWTTNWDGSGSSPPRVDLFL